MARIGCGAPASVQRTVSERFANHSPTPLSPAGKAIRILGSLPDRSSRCAATSPSRTRRLRLRPSSTWKSRARRGAGDSSAVRTAPGSPAAIITAAAAHHAGRVFTNRPSSDQHDLRCAGNISERTPLPKWRRLRTAADAREHESRMASRKLSRREFARLSAAALLCRAPRLRAATPRPPLREFGYADVRVDSALQRAQLESTHEVLMQLSEDSLLKPFRQMAGMSAPGADLGGWYNYDPDYDWHREDAGFAPGATFGQWISSLARYHAITGSQAAQARVLRLNELYAATISEGF